ncbi:hypothetical protein J4E85_006546 [Alternaria conjuncta]|uniref:uncharacterized protein n=1 Tax=Alternaria conjuncta TaxID=181017 RepID=UPI002220B82F|nr:uncharacterized protein J4E85_006546 [Alternaria conjuncta]KAI4926254.1 hypothetical protein J4E85_006546 [Alternaria conjuncta]
MSVNSVPTSPLLKLPGELRNCIYNYAQDPRDVRLIHKPARQHEQTNTTERQFFGLTQACRQLRAEYMPIHRAQTKAHIQCQDSVSYIKTFISSSGADPKIARGNVIVHLPDLWYESRGASSTQRDIIQVIYLCRSAPQVNVAFALCELPLSQSRFSGRGMHHSLRDLTQPEATPELHDFIENSVEHVECWIEMRLDDSSYHLNDYVHVVFNVDEEWKDCLSDG